MEQAARDKSRAEQEKSAYEVRTVDHFFRCHPNPYAGTCQSKHAGSGDGEDDEEE
jgi:hypothetical protein